jgi:hypothetical protein
MYILFVNVALIGFTRNVLDELLLLLEWCLICKKHDESLAIKMA